MVCSPVTSKTAIIDIFMDWNWLQDPYNICIDIHKPSIGSAVRNMNYLYFSTFIFSFQNNEIFDHPYDTCKQCMCQTGCAPGDYDEYCWEKTCEDIQCVEVSLAIVVYTLSIINRLVRKQARVDACNCYIYPFAFRAYWSYVYVVCVATHNLRPKSL